MPLFSKNYKRSNSYNNINIDQKSQQGIFYKLIKSAVSLALVYALVGVLLLVTNSLSSSFSSEELKMNSDEHSLTIILPTYNEAGNIEDYHARLLKAFHENEYNLSVEVLVVDDDSPDGTSKIVTEYIKKMEDMKKILKKEESSGQGFQAIDKVKTRLITRKTDKGLAPAVMEGIKQANTDIVLVMDADLSHPPEIIHSFAYQLIMGKADFVVASRYVKGGKVENWPLFRKVVSIGATFLARPLVNINDPMSGMFAFRKSMITSDVSKTINTVGFKIGLELLVKLNPKKVVEIPFTFKDRVFGDSKLKSKIYFQYLQQLMQLYIYKYGLLFCISLIIIPIVVIFYRNGVLISTTKIKEM